MSDKLSGVAKELNLCKKARTPNFQVAECFVWQDTRVLAYEYKYGVQVQ
jgi:hypothetical protein